MFIHAVTGFESHISEVAFPGQPVWKRLGNRFVEAHAHGNSQDKETELGGIGISFAVLS
jgi:hypothetical protein